MFLLRLSFDFANTNTLTSLSAFGLEHRFSSAHTFYLFLYLFFKFALIVVLPLQIAGLNMLQIMVSVCVCVWLFFGRCLYTVIGMLMHSHSMSEQKLRPQFAYFFLPLSYGLGRVFLLYCYTLKAWHHWEI